VHLTLGILAKISGIFLALAFSQLDGFAVTRPSAGNARPLGAIAGLFRNKKFAISFTWRTIQMKKEVLGKERSSFYNLNATRVIATTIGVIFGISGFNHGFFEFLQGNTPADGIVIQAIGEAQRFWVEGTEPAFTMIPNFLISGLLSMALGLTIVIWSLRFIQTRYGRTVYLALFILLFLVGGGIGQIIFFIPAWAFATQMNKPLTWWRKVLPQGIWPFLSNLWIITLILSSIAILIGLEIAIFGFFPGITDPENINNMALLLVLISALLNIISFIAGFGHELKRMNPGNELVSR
jgi:hypothetical protein